MFEEVNKRFEYQSNDPSIKDFCIDLFKSCMNNKSSSGKKMNFLLQEMLRETNTICSKANNVNISHLAVNMKNNLEQLKEQVQNIL